MFYQDVLNAIRKKSVADLDELFKRSDADPNVREYVDFAGRAGVTQHKHILNLKLLN